MNNNLETTNVVAPMPPKKSGSKVIIVILLLLVIAMGGFIAYDKVLKKKPEPQKCECEKCKDNTDTNTTNTTTNDSKEPTRQDIVDFVKKYMSDNNLAKPDYIQTWTFDKVEYVGYYKNDPTKRLYRVSGKFKCSKYEEGLNYPSCVYQAQLEDPDENDVYPWSIYATVITEEWGSDIESVGGTYTIDSPEYSEIFVKVEKELK